MNVTQLANYYQTLTSLTARNSVSSTSSTSAVTAAPSSTTGSGTTSTTTAAAKEDTVTLSKEAYDAAELADAKETLDDLDTNLRQLRSLADLAAQSSVSDDFRTQLNAKAADILKEMDGVFQDSDGTALKDLVNLSSAEGAGKARTLIEEGLQATAAKRVELGLTEAATATAATASASSKKLSSEELAAMLSELRNSATGTTSEIGTLLSAVNGTSGSAMSSLYSLLS